MIQNLSQKNNYELIGKIVNTHGIKGHLKVILKPSNFIINLQSLGNMYVEGMKHINLELEKISDHKNAYLFKFKNLNNINDVEMFKGKNLYSEIDKSERDYFFYELINLEVIYKNKKVGVVNDYFLQGNFYSLSLDDNEELTIPINDKFIKKLNREEKHLEVDFPEGYLNE